ncbi:hypothetical protein C474_03330 [Halogeometricum pallidum JCM 14848]|uniref:Uncharacterized protein n=1 Tax=Halogeometricum pallidum JCM 14848 TaxID=1227487 RepID=M0DIF6_HALPD|nr:hypothetical protein [Halogeometricum pallidum]ELZ33959.1 hypothetical protein C474_03330 [Halogeometricum pallidum JCM 14848]
MIPLPRRARVASGGFLVGLLAGVAALVVAAVFSGVADGADTALRFGALFFGVGFLGWSGSALAARGVGSGGKRPDAGLAWTGANFRRSMARVGGFGAGVMAAAATLGALLA